MLHWHLEAIITEQSKVVSDSHNLSHSLSFNIRSAPHTVRRDSLWLMWLPSPPVSYALALSPAPIIADLTLTTASDFWKQDTWSCYRGWIQLGSWYFPFLLVFSLFWVHFFVPIFLICTFATSNCYEFLKLILTFKRWNPDFSDLSSLSDTKLN